jgi:hypothetical protein
MKTVFKLGQKAYDQINFPDKEGRVVRILDDKDHKFYIGVFFKGEDFPIFYNNEGCLSGTKIQTLSTNPYKVILEGFEQKPYIPTFEDIVKERNYIYLPENLVAPNKELAEAAKALFELLFLRDYYNEGWQPNYVEKETKHTIITFGGVIETGTNIQSNRILCFKTEKIRDMFLEEQRELIEIAKPLL